MSKLNFKFIGWYEDRYENSDKVWGAIHIGGDRAITVWGKRGKKLQTKIVPDDNELVKLIRSKRNKGYNEIDYDRLNTVYPEFQKDLEKTAFWASFK